MMENEKNDRGRETERGRATMRNDLEREKKVGANLFCGLFIPPGERERERERERRDCDCTRSVIVNMAERGDEVQSSSACASV